jgi:hypothetical protein
MSLLLLFNRGLLELVAAVLVQVRPVRQTIIRDGQMTVKDPSDVLVYQMEWDDDLDADVLIATSTFTITRISGGTSTDLTADNDLIVTGDRAAQVRLTGGTVGARYRIDNRIVTDETPTQTKERSFVLKIENR